MALIRVVQNWCIGVAVAGLFSCAASSAEVRTVPGSSVALAAAARAAYAQKNYAECAKLFSEASKRNPQNQSDAYDASCCLALADDRDGAFEMLERAVELGFREFAHLENDTDLTSLHGDPRWEPLEAKIKAKQDAYLKTLNPELWKLFQEDQADRGGGDPTKINWSELNWAHQLALKAVELDPANKTARWLAAASKDRELMNQGKAQLYGTQFTMEGERWVLYQVDASVTDEEREKWNVPPLEAAKRKAEAMNAARQHP